MSRKRPISDADRELFRNAAGDVRPVRDDRHRPPPRRPPARPRVQPAEPAPDDDPTLSDDTTGVVDRTGESLWHVRPGVQHRVARRLRRGQIPADDELDLHGMTVEQARRRVAAHLDATRARGGRCLRIIHGKGRGSAREGPALKSMLDRWLRMREDVIAFCSARPEDGGTGAVYVLLKR